MALSAQDRRLRDDEALALRVKGESYSAIASKVAGLSDKSAARKAVMRALDRAAPELDMSEARRQEVARLDWLLASIADKVEAGDLGAVDRALRVEKLRVDVQGLKLEYVAPPAVPKPEAAKGAEQQPDGPEEPAAPAPKSKDPVVDIGSRRSARRTGS